MLIKEYFLILSCFFKSHALLLNYQLKRKGANIQVDQKIEYSPRFGMNRALKGKKEYLFAIETVKKLGFNLHPDPPKNWDHLLSFNFIVKHINSDGNVVDAGGESYSTLVDWLYLVGYKNLSVINLAFSSNYKRGPINYVKGDCTKTSLADGSIDIISCLSVIEHGLNIDDFLSESYRILKPNGYLIISTDYYPDKIIVNNINAYGVPVNIYSKEEIKKLISRAAFYGFVTDQISYDVTEKAVNWLGLNFSFIIFALQKKKK